MESKPKSPRKPPLPFSKADIAAAQRYARMAPGPEVHLDPRVEALVHELIGRVADKWTLLVIETLQRQGTLRFSQLSELLPAISQKMLTQTLRQLERDGLVTRTVYPVVPPKVEYALTGLGLTLGAAFCGVWVWAQENLAKVDKARKAFEGRQSG